MPTIHKPFELCQATLQRWLASRPEVLDALSPDERRLLIATIWRYAPGTLWRRNRGMTGKPALIKALRSLLARLLEPKVIAG